MSDKLQFVEELDKLKLVGQFVEELDKLKLVGHIITLRELE